MVWSLVYPLSLLLATAGPKSILNNIILVWLLGEENSSDEVYILEER